MHRQLSTTFLTIFFALTVYFVQGQDLKVKFYNITGYDVDSLIVGKTFVGHISKDSASTFLKFPNFGFDSGIPLAIMKGIIQGKTLQQSNWSRCSTERSRETEGEFIFDLSITKFSFLEKDNKEKKYFTLRRHPGSPNVERNMRNKFEK